VRGGDRKAFVSEINTLPGFTSVSMYPKLWEATGIPYPALIERLIDLAMERHAEGDENQRSLAGGSAPRLAVNAA
jgi:D-alanine-D-alanine ligase